MKILLLKRRNIGMNIEMYFTYVNLGLLFHFLCNLPILYGFAAHCLFGVVFLHNRDLSNENVDVSHVKNCNWKMIFSLFQCSDQTNSYSGPLNKGTQIRCVKKNRSIKRDIELPVANHDVRNVRVLVA